MAGRPHLRERDKELLRLIGRYGFVTREQAQMLFGTKEYYRHRLRKLDEMDYIVRHRNGIIRLGRKGREFLGTDKAFTPLNPRQVPRRLQLAELEIYLRNISIEWEWVPSFELKKHEGATVPQFCKISGLLQHGSTAYIVYILSQHPTRKTIAKVKEELNRFSRSGYRRAIIFCKSPEAMERFGHDSFWFEELHLLPYPHGIQLLVFLIPDNIVRLGRFLFGEVATGENPLADFTAVVDGRKVDFWFLATNDTARINRLQAYLKIRWQGVTHQREVAIVCLEPQRERYENLFPGVQVYTFDLGEAAVKLGLTKKPKL